MQQINPKLLVIFAMLLITEFILVKLRLPLPFNLAYPIMVVNFLFLFVFIIPDMKKRHLRSKRQGK